MSNIVYIADYRPGVQSYYPELGDRKPAVKMEASLSFYGTHYFIDTPIELKGRGIVEESACWTKGSQKDVEGWKTYRVTKKAFEKLKEQYPISMERYLD